jgi:Uma2 family endonuclease
VVLAAASCEVVEPMSQVVTAAWPDRLLDLRDWEALPVDESHHIECVEGVLIVTPKPLPRHQRTMVALCHELDQALPESLVALADVEVLLNESPLTVRAPDVVVVDRSVARGNPARFDIGSVRLVVEVVSEGSRRTDRVTKMSEYAEAGIPEYWIVDLSDPVTLSVHGVTEQRQYDLDGEYSGRTRLRACGVDVELDLEAIARI